MLQRPPFAGEIHDGYVWGRGALDMKGGVAMLISAFLRAKAEGLSLPGDVVLGDPTGVTFIPPHLVEEVVTRSEDIRQRDDFGHLRLRQQRYTPGEIDRTWPPAIEADFQAWLAAGKPHD